MSVNLKEAEALFDLCRKHGVRRVKTEDLEVEFGPVAAEAGPDAKKMRALAEALASDTITDEQALFGSAPQAVSFEQIQAMMKRVTGG